MRTDQERYHWLSQLKCNSFTLAKNEDHAPNYRTAQQWIEENPEDYNGISDEERQKMIDTNVIWKLQVYERTPVGSVTAYSSTMGGAIDALMDEGIGT